MNLVRCENGHFYDAERFSFCPHCNQGSVSTVLHDDNGEAMYTMPLESPVQPIPNSDLQMYPQSESNGLDTLVSQVKETDDGGQATIGYFGEVETEPVVGWLVAVEGAHYGEDFRLKTGRNFIGRSSNMDVALTGDPTISRDKHAVILYEPKANIFLVQPGDSKELFYLNDKVVLSAAEIEAFDILSLGNTKLLFVPCCSEKFSWDKAKNDNEDSKS